MRALVKQALQEGAVGLSAGLEYEPGRWSTTDEVVELARELPAFNGIYISHERSEGSDPLWYVPSQDGPNAVTLLDAVRETIEIGEKTGARVVASHLKAKGEHYWGSSAAAVTLIQRARDRGVDVWADQYPYPTSGTDGSTVLIPAWATRPPGANANQPRTNRADILKRVLGDPPSAKLVRSDIAHEIRRRGGADNITVYEYTDKSLYGKSLAEIARLWKLDPVETAIKIQMEGLQERNGGARMRGFSMAEFDMENIAKQQWVATSTDAGIAMPADGPSTHARFYGSFTRKIRHYAIDRGAITLEHAIRSSTSLPARIMDSEGSRPDPRRLRRRPRDLRPRDDSRQGDLLRAAPALRRRRLRLRQRHRRRRRRQADPRDARQSPGALNFTRLRSFSVIVRSSSRFGVWPRFLDPDLTTGGNFRDSITVLVQ